MDDGDRGLDVVTARLRAALAGGGLYVPVRQVTKASETGDYAVDFVFCRGPAPPRSGAVLYLPMFTSEATLNAVGLDATQCVHPRLRHLTRLFSVEQWVVVDPGVPPGFRVRVGDLQELVKSL